MTVWRVISYLFHPVFYPTILFFILINYLDELHVVFLLNKYSLLTTILVFTIFFPGIAVLFLLRLNKIKSLEMKTRKERRKSLFIVFIIMLLGIPFFEEISREIPVLMSIYLAFCVILIFAYIITKRWKISLHMLGIGSTIGTFITLNYIYKELYAYSLFFILLSFLLAKARMEENSHNKLQVYSGLLLGTALQSMFILSYNSIISTISIFRSSIASIL